MKVRMDSRQFGGVRPPKISVSGKSMNSTISPWFNTLDLNERLTLLASTTEIDLDLGQKRFTKWRSQAPLERDAYFEQRLKVDGLDVASFIQLLGVRSNELPQKDGAFPGWLNKLQIILEQFYTGGRASETSDHTNRILLLAEPFIQDGCNTLQNRIEELTPPCEHYPFDRRTVYRLFVPALRERIGAILIRALVLELNVA